MMNKQFNHLKNKYKIKRLKMIYKIWIINIMNNSNNKIMKSIICKIFKIQMRLLNRKINKL